MTVINTSPAIYLHAALPGGLASLVKLIGEVVVPLEVVDELLAGHAKDTTGKAIQGVLGLQPRNGAVAIHPLLRSQLDLGEAAVIQTALDEGHRVVILDDLKARRLALTMGLSVTGTLGILIQARRSAHLPSLRHALAVLARRGMWITPALATKAIALAGEDSGPDPTGHGGGPPSS